MTSNTFRSVMDALARLDQALDDAVINTPGTDSAFDRKILSVVRGGPIRPAQRKKMTGMWLADAWNTVEYHLQRVTYNWMTSSLYDRRGVMTSSGVRVRSRPEKAIADFLDTRKLTWRYEDPLTVGGVKLHPDFFLPKEGKSGVYIEYWGMPDREKYRETMKRKQRLYRSHGITVVSLYPNNVKDPETGIPACYVRDTGMDMPDYSR